jgi:4-amino-4-deoxy-L-arabinose transferase-like glycosyltransferase
MPGFHVRCRGLIGLVFLSAVTLLPGLGSSSRLTYHEAFVAQGSREMLTSGNWAHPTIGGLPWLEKPPLPWWLVAALGRCVGGVSEAEARFPSALAAIALSVGVAVLAGRHYGSHIGLLAGAIQATTVWTVVRGRLAEADILLTCLITWAMVAFDSMSNAPVGEIDQGPGGSSYRGVARWAFFVLLGMTSLVKGIGFGAVLILAVVAGTLAWRRDRGARRGLWSGTGWILTAIITTAWPCLILAKYGSRALALWTMHITDRLAGQPGPGPFAGESWWEYTLGLLGQTLPWTPFAFIGGWGSFRRAMRWQGNAENRQLGDRIPTAVLSGDRLLWTWALIPLGVLALATVKNAHYAISAQVPWSIWGALGLARLEARLRLRGWALRLMPKALFAALAIGYGLGYWLLVPRFDRRGVEWAFYESAGRQLPDNVPLALLYDDWDRNPYESSFGPIPHDLAVRLFYLGRTACWHIGSDSLFSCDLRCTNTSFSRSQVVAGHTSPYPPRSVFCVIGRERDLPVLKQLGSVEVVARGPNIRFDRTYSLFRVTTVSGSVTPGEDLASSYSAPYR